MAGKTAEKDAETVMTRLVRRFEAAGYALADRDGNTENAPQPGQDGQYCLGAFGLVAKGTGLPGMLRRRGTLVAVLELESERYWRMSVYGEKNARALKDLAKSVVQECDGHMKVRVFPRKPGMARRKS